MDDVVFPLFKSVDNLNQGKFLDNPDIKQPFETIKIIYNSLKHNYREVVHYGVIYKLHELEVLDDILSKRTKETDPNRFGHQKVV